MGKALSFLVAACDLGLLVLLVQSGGQDVPRAAGLLLGFVLLAALAWLIALLSALAGALVEGRDWRWVLGLLAFLWLPVLPALCFGLSGLRRRRSMRRALPPAPFARLALSRGGAHA
jgi:hypothetical protein